METLEEQFNEVVRELENGLTPDVLVRSDFRKQDCEGYKKIVALGKDALPLIRKLYDKPVAYFPGVKWCLPRIIENITQLEFQLPIELCSDYKKYEQYIIKLLDDHGYGGNN